MYDTCEITNKTSMKSLSGKASGVIAQTDA